ncbi:MAG: hypothetical protein RL235_304 [Chlamydiota bacterium]|jgi:hypothetical protein
MIRVSNHPIAYFAPSLSISKNVFNATAEDAWLKTAQKIAVATIIPFMIIVLFEALLKNTVLLTLDLFIWGLNRLCLCRKSTTPPPAAP